MYNEEYLFGDNQPQDVITDMLKNTPVIMYSFDTDSLITFRTPEHAYQYFRILHSKLPNDIKRKLIDNILKSQTIEELRTAIAAQTPRLKKCTDEWLYKIKYNDCEESIYNIIAFHIIMSTVTQHYELSRILYEVQEGHENKLFENIRKIIHNRVRKGGMSVCYGFEIKTYHTKIFYQKYNIGNDVESAPLEAIRVENNTNEANEQITPIFEQNIFQKAEYLKYMIDAKLLITKTNILKYLDISGQQTPEELQVLTIKSFDSTKRQFTLNIKKQFDKQDGILPHSLEMFARLAKLNKSVEKIVENDETYNYAITVTLREGFNFKDFCKISERNLKLNNLDYAVYLYNSSKTFKVLKHVTVGLFTMAGLAIGYHKSLDLIKNIALGILGFCIGRFSVGISVDLYVECFILKSIGRAFLDIFSMGHHRMVNDSNIRLVKEGEKAEFYYYMQNDQKHWRVAITAQNHTRSEKSK